MNISVLGTDYSLYAHVHHSYGLNDAFDRSVAHLLTAQQSQQLDGNTEAALQDSVHQKPLDQDDTAVAAEATTEAAEGRQLVSDESLPTDTAAAREAVEGTRLAQDESLPADAVDREEAEGRRLGQHESSPAASATAESSRHINHLSVLKDDERYVDTLGACNDFSQSVTDRDLLRQHHCFSPA